MSPMNKPISLSKLRLPRLRATGALALADALIHQTQGQPLSAHVKAALDELTEDRDALRSALGLKTATEETPGVREADKAEDAAWGILRDFLEVWGRLPGAQGEAARKVQGAVFGEDGLMFVQLPVEEEKAVADAKLEIIDDKGQAKIIKSLGGQPILDHLRQVHERYGQAIHAAHAAEQAESPKIREPLSSLLGSLQSYVTRVAGSVERKQPETRKAAEHLLFPLLSWERGSTPAREPAPAKEPTPPGN